MRFRSTVSRLVILVSVTFPSLAVTVAHAADCQNLSWSNDQLSKFDAAIASGQHAARREGAARQSLEIDAAIASLEQDITTRTGEAATRGQAALKDIHAARDAFRTRLGQPLNQVVSAATADAGQRSDETANTLWTKVNAYLDAVNADISARQAATQTRFMGN